MVVLVSDHSSLLVSPCLVTWMSCLLNFVGEVLVSPSFLGVKWRVFENLLWEFNVSRMATSKIPMI